MGSRPWIISSVVMLLLLTPSSNAFFEADDGEVTPREGRLVDVRIIDAECLIEHDCEPVQPAHLVEYYSADWCEPCRDVSAQLTNLSNETAVVLQHHGSPADSTFLSASKLRYDDTYRLLFLPAMVVDGSHLLTGTRQAMDLETVLANSTPAWSGLSSLVVSNQTLLWNASLDGTVRAWYAEPTPHTKINATHPSLARSMISINASAGELNISDIATTDEGFLVVMLEIDGPRTLISASLAPTGQMELSDGSGNPASASPASTEAQLAVIVTLFLMALLLPAMLMQRNLMKADDATTLAISRAEE